MSLKNLKKFIPKIAESIKDAIHFILEGEEVILVKYKDKHEFDLKKDTDLVNPDIASKLETNLILNIPEITEFVSLCYGKNWGLRPCPIHSSEPHTIITKNIGIHIGLSPNQLFEFSKNSSQNAISQKLMFKLKPNHNLTQYNHITYYNRFDGIICLESTDHYVEYDATSYLLIFAPLIVVHKRKDMLQLTANICFETDFNLRVLGNNIREWDIYCAKTGQLGYITHHGHPNPLLIKDKQNIHPSKISENRNLDSYILNRYLSTYDTSEPDSTSILDGTLFKLFPSFLFRRNWFTALGNQREHGTWITACDYWIFDSSLSKSYKKFLIKNWVPSMYQNKDEQKNNKNKKQEQKDLLNRKQEKFIKLNMKLLIQKLEEINSNLKTNEDNNENLVLVSDSFLPNEAWEKLLKRRVIKQESIKSSTKKSSKKQKEKSKKSSYKKPPPFHILPPEEQTKETETMQSKQWLQRIHENIESKKEF